LELLSNLLKLLACLLVVLKDALGKLFHLLVLRLLLRQLRECHFALVADGGVQHEQAVACQVVFLLLDLLELLIDLLIDLFAVRRVVSGRRCVAGIKCRRRCARRCPVGVGLLGETETAAGDGNGGDGAKETSTMSHNDLPFQDGQE